MNIHKISKIPSSIRETLWEEDKVDLNYQEEAREEKWTIELKRGTAKVFKEDRNNVISTTRTNGLLLIPYALLTNFTKYGNLFFLVISIIMISAPDLTPYYRWITAFPLFIFTLLHVFKVFYMYYLRRREDKKVNLQTTRRAKKGTGEIEENVLWRNLRPGDIVYLKKDEKCPADLILLDTSLPKNRDSICWIDTANIDGISTSIMKKAANATKMDKSSTRKGNYAEFRKILSGKIEYEPPTSHSKHNQGFSGYVKLKKDPRAEPLSEENFVPRGSVLKNTDWIYGLCVYTGNDTRIMYYPRRSTNKGNYFDRLAEKFFLTGIGLIFLFSIITIGIFKGHSDDLILKLEFPEGLPGSRFVLYIILYSPLLPIAFYATSELILLSKVVSLQSKNKLQASESKSRYVKVLDPSALPNLGHVDYCLIDKTGTLTTSKYKVKAIFTNARFYNINPVYLREKGDEFVKRNSLPLGAVFEHNKPEHTQGTKNPHTPQHQRDKSNNQDITVPTVHEVGDEPHQVGTSPEKPFKFMTHVQRLETYERNETDQSQRELIQSSDKKNLLEMLKTEGDEEQALTKREENNLVLKLEAEEEDDQIEDLKTPKRAEGKNKNIDLMSPEIPIREDVELLADTPKGFSPTDRFSVFTPRSDKRQVESIDDLIEKNFNEKTFLNDCHSFGGESIQQFIKTLALCHSVRSKYTENKYVYESPISEELPLVELGTLGGKSFVLSNRPDNPTKYTVNEKGAAVDYKILGVNNFSYKRRKFSIVEKANEETPAYIYAKGAAHDIKSSLNMDSFQMALYDSLVSHLEIQGYKVIVFAGRELEAEEEENFLKKYQSYKMSLYSQDVELDALAREVEKDLKFIGLVALEDELRPDAAEMVLNLHRAGIKSWMATGDTEENAINVSYLSNMIKKSSKINQIKFDNIEDGKAVIRNTLNNYKKLMEKESAGMTPSKNLNSPTYKFEYKDNVVLTINGDTLDIVLKDAYLKTNFTFLCNLSDTVIGYQLNPTHKKMLVFLIKHNFPKSPTVMAIGDGHNDKPMLQAADISFEIKTTREGAAIQAGDIQVNSLSQIPKILFVDGRDISEKIERSLHFTFYKSLIFGIPIFIWNASNTGASVPLFDSMLVFLYSFVFTFLSPLFFGAFDKSEPKDILLAFPALYIDAKDKKRRSWINFCVQALVEGIIHGVLVYEIVGWAVQETYSKEGLVSTEVMLSLAQYYTIAVVVHVKLYGYFKDKKIIWAFATILSLVSILIYIFINDQAQFVSSDYTGETKQIFRRPASLLSMFFVIGFCGFINFLLRRLITTKIFETWYMYFGRKMKESQGLKITNEYIFAASTKPEELGSIVRGVYKQVEHMDPVVQQMINPADRSLGELDIKRYTLHFGDSRLGRQYKLIKSRLVSRNFRFIYLAFLVVFAGYIIGTSILTEMKGYTLSRLGVFLAFFVLGAALLSKFYQSHHFEITFVFIILCVAAKIAFDWTRIEDSALGAALVSSCIATAFNIYAFWLFLANTAYYIVYVARIIVLFNVDYDNSKTLIVFYVLWSLAVIIGAIMFIISSLSFRFEKQQRSEFIANSKVQGHIHKTDDILSILLPKFIKEKISRLGHDKSLAEDQGEVAILFCDIMDFDKIIKSEGKNLVRILDRIFRTFDELCGTQGVQKIETVGKTYMGCAGLKSCEYGIAKEILALHPIRRILYLALSMEEYVKTVTYGNGYPLKLRIGLHYGRVIAGVIGYHKPQFSLIGDAVNTTSRVCVVNNPGQIRMSDDAHKKMMECGGPGHSELYFIPKTEEMKGKGEVKIHIIARKSTNVLFKGKIGLALKKNKEHKKFGALVTSNDKEGFTKKGTLHSIFENKGTFNTGDMLKKLNTLKSGEAEDKPLAKGELERNKTTDAKDIEIDYNSEESDDEEEKNAKLLRYNTFTLRFDRENTKYSKGEFEDQINKTSQLFSILVMAVLLLVHVIQTAIYLAVIGEYTQEFTHDAPITVIRFVFAAALALIMILDKRLTKKRLKKRVAFAVFVFGLIVSAIHASYAERDIYYKIQALELMLIFVVAIHGSGFDFLNSLLFTGCLIVIFFVSYGVKSLLDITNVFFFWIFVLANLIQKYFIIKDEIRFFKNIQLREKRKVEQRGLVGQLLPLHASEEYFNNPTGRVDISDEFTDVSILYADIKGFTDYSAGVEPTDVVTMLSALFTKFDKVCVQYSLYKVYTIGDCYVALSFYDKNKRNPGKEVNNMVKMALSMIQIIREVRKEVNFDGLDMRIGIHTGTIIGGIVGTDIIRYDIWGQDCLIANAMESEGVKGNINVSESTKNLLEVTNSGLYRFEPHKIVNMEKIQAKVPCYLLYANDESIQE